METNTRLTQWTSKINDKLNEQAWVQQLKSKWEELDPQSKTYLQMATIVSSLLVVLVLITASIWNVKNLKKEVSDKADLLTLIHTANEELRRLRDATPASAQGGKPLDQNETNWNTFFESTAGTAGIEKTSLSIGQEKTGTTSDMAKENLIDLTLKHVNVKQIVQFAYHLENTMKPVKLRNLTIDTKSDPTGYMDATLSVSAFSFKQ